MSFGPCSQTLCVLLIIKVTPLQGNYVPSIFKVPDQYDMTEVIEREGPNLDIAKFHLERILDKRVHPKTMCPSEAARALSKDELETSHVTEWRELMQPLRRLVFEMRDNGEVEVLQKGLVLPLDQTVEVTSGPIRLRRPQRERRN